MRKMEYLLAALLSFVIASMIFQYMVYTKECPDCIKTCEPKLECPECPSPQINHYPTYNMPYNNIQSYHLDNVDVDKRGNKICVDDMDRVVSISGFSMRPTMFDGNYVILKEYSGQVITEGMIVRFEKDDGFVIHRVRGIYDDYIYTQGDSNKYGEKINRTQITDIVTGVIFE